MNEIKMMSFSEHLDMQYGKIGTEERERYEQEFEAFKLGALIQELRKEMGLTQEELALKSGTSKKSISNIENNINEAKFSNILKILNEGLGVSLKLSIDNLKH